MKKSEKWKVSVTNDGKTEVYEWGSYYEILHFIFDVLIFKIKKEDINISIEYLGEDDETILKTN